MTDPRRLATGGDDLSDLGTSELTRWLITSARDEEPGTVALQRTLLSVGATGAVIAATSSAGVGATAGVTGGGSAVSVSSGAAVSGGATSVSVTSGTAAIVGKAATTASLAGTLGKAAALKWIAVGVIGGATVIGGGSKFFAATKPTTPATPAHGATPAPALPAQRAPAAHPALAVSPVEAPVAAPAARTTANATSGGPAAVDQVDSEIAAATALHKEVLLIDRAREAQAAGQNARVIALTQQYVNEFPRGRLVPEAIFLKMESENNLGRTEQAAQSARLLLRIAPGSPQAKRARELAAPSATAP